MAVLDLAFSPIGTYSARNVIIPALVTGPGATNGNSPGFNVVDLNPSLGAANTGDFVDAPDIVVQIMQTLTSAGAATVQFRLVQADDSALTSGVQVIKQTDPFPFTVLTAGTRIPIRIDRAAPYAPKRYFGMQIAIAGAALTNATGQFFAASDSGYQDTFRAFNAGYSIV